MAKLDVKVLSGEETYQISVNGKLSEVGAYGDPVEVEVDGVEYVGYVEVDEKGDLSSPFVDLVFIATAVPSELVEVEGDGEGEQGEQGEGEIEDGDEDEEETLV